MDSTLPCGVSSETRLPTTSQKSMITISPPRTLLSLPSAKQKQDSSNMEAYITICKTDSQREFGVWLRKLKQGLCVNLEGWDGEVDGRKVQKGGDICTPMADSC